ncbi:MAG: hypothetical protein M1503_08530 [Thaumarchaeota archaeon]|nr:hypothetical protein [Nitrososphaerota archaeon]
MLASIIMISITLAGGMMVWSFVNTTSAQVTDAYGQTVSNDINGLNEDFIITNVSFNPTNHTVTIWFYNNGAMATKIQQILIWSSSNTTATSTQTALNLTKGSAGSLGPLTISRINRIGETYYVEAIAQYGSTYTTYSKAS